MKKKTLGLLTLLTLTLLGACSQKNTSPSSAKSTSSTTSAYSSEVKVDDGKSKYAAVLERYSQYIDAGKMAKRQDYANLSSKYPFEEQNASRTFFEQPNQNYQFTYYDVNGDGVYELLLGTKDYLLALYYLNGDEPTIIGSAGAYDGGSRQSLTISPDELITARFWRSISPNGTEKILKLAGKPVQLETVEEKEYSVPDAAEPASIDLTSLKWEGILSSQLPQAAKKGDMDPRAIANGDFSSIEGTWQNSKGLSYTFDKNGLVDEEYQLSSYGPMIHRGIVYYGVGSKTKMIAGAPSMMFLPKGVAMPTIEGISEKSDQTKDRLWVGNGASYEPEDFYYKLKEK